MEASRGGAQADAGAPLDRGIALTVLALVLVTGFVLFAVFTSLEVRAGRALVETRVGWLREIGPAGRALVACDAARDEALAVARRVADASGTELVVGETCDEAELAREREAVGAVERAIRGQTATLSVTLGDAVDRLFYVAVGACVVALGLGVVLVVLFRTRRALARAAAELRLRALEMADRERIIRASAAITAHEIMNPLLFLRLRTEEVRARGDAPREHELELVQAASEAGERIARIVGDLRELGREDPDRLERVDLALVAERLRRLAGPTAPGARLDVSTRPVPAVRGNAARLAQVILNLVRNAQDATQEIADAHVRLAVFSERREVFVEVHDNGRGISETVRGRLFEPFVTSKGEAGTGLGLFVSRTIVESCGGTLTLTDVEGGGTLARVVLPAHREPAQGALDAT